MWFKYGNFLGVSTAVKAFKFGWRFCEWRGQNGALEIPGKVLVGVEEL